MVLVVQEVVEEVAMLVRKEAMAVRERMVVGTHLDLECCHTQKRLRRSALHLVVEDRLVGVC